MRFISVLILHLHAQKVKDKMAEIAQNFTAEEFLVKIPDRDQKGNEIPLWKRQMMARKAAEKAKKEAEEEIKKQVEEKKARAIPQWKKQLIKKEENLSYIR